MVARAFIGDIGVTNTRFALVGPEARFSRPSGLMRKILEPRKPKSCSATCSAASPATWRLPWCPRRQLYRPGHRPQARANRVSARDFRPRAASAPISRAFPPRSLSTPGRRLSAPHTCSSLDKSGTPSLWLTLSRARRAERPGRSAATRPQHRQPQAKGSASNCLRTLLHRNIER